MGRESSRATACDEFRRASRTTRRELIGVGSLLGLGLGLPELFRDKALAAAAGTPRARGFGRARSVIMLFLHGGHAQQETWDPKPAGPSSTRGEFGAIATRTEGIRISELLPRSAGIVPKLAIIRSLTHSNANHVQASLSAMTGQSHPPEAERRGDFPPSPTDFPAIGAVLDQVRPSASLPTWVQVGPTMRRANGTVLHGQSPGFLGGRHAPLVIDQDMQGDQVRVEGLGRDPLVPSLRLYARRDLLRSVDDERARLDRSAAAQTLDSYQQRALSLLTAPETAQAFDLSSETPATRDEYGRTAFGQSCLMARRLAEAGVPMINVHFCQTPTGSWDTHGRHFPQMKDKLCPILDQAFTAIVSDLDRRGRLDETLVLATAEFGRTPKINAAGGRDHWPWVYSVAAAGAGMPGGTVLGASDAMAAYPVSHPHDPSDLIATIYHLLGVPRDTIIYDQVHRPHPLYIGQPITELLG